MKTYRAPAIWITKYYLAIGVYLLMAASLIAAAIRYFTYPPLAASDTPVEKIMLTLLSGVFMAIIARQVFLLLNQSYQVSIDAAGIRCIHAFRASRIEVIQRIERGRRHPRSPLKPAEQLHLTTPFGNGTLVLDVAQVDAFLDDVRRANPDVDTVGFETVFNAAPYAGELPWQVKIIRRYPIFITVASGSIALFFLPFSLGAVIQSVLSIIDFIQGWRWSSLLIAIGCLVPAGAIVIYAREFMQMRRIPRVMQLHADALDIQTGAGRDTIPLMAIRAITARRMGSQLWISLSYDHNGRHAQVMLPTLILSDPTTLIATLHALNPAITLDGFDGHIT